MKTRVCTYEIRVSYVHTQVRDTRSASKMRYSRQEMAHRMAKTHLHRMFISKKSHIFSTIANCVSE
jgi:hypothetical protein